MRYFTNIFVAIIGIVEAVLNFLSSLIGIYPAFDLVMSFLVWKEVYTISQSAREQQKRDEEKARELIEKSYKLDNETNK